MMSGRQGIYGELNQPPGMMIKHVAGIRRAWDSPAINDLQDSYGQEWTYRSTALPGNGVEDF